MIARIVRSGVGAWADDGLSDSIDGLKSIEDLEFLCSSISELETRINFCQGEYDVVRTFQLGEPPSPSDPTSSNLFLCRLLEGVYKETEASF